jgi:thiol-disulfide isomerase/thioredoxin
VGTGKLERDRHEPKYSRDAEETARTPWLEPAEKKVEWQSDVLKAYDQAVVDRKPLIVKFQTDWCDYCKELDQKVLFDKRFQNLADKAVFVVANPEKDTVAADLGKQLKVDGYPTVAVMSATADLLKETGRVVGLLPADKFMAQLEKHLPAGTMTAPADRTDPQPLVDNKKAPAPDESEALNTGDQQFTDNSSVIDAVSSLFPSWGSIFSDLLGYTSASTLTVAGPRPRCHDRREPSV